MPTWNHRLLPHPLLAPWSDDYPGKAFETLVPHAVLNNGKEMSFTIKYNLTSRYLRSLVDNGSAEYVAILTCSRTGLREEYRTNQTDEVYVVPAANYSRTVRIHAFVVATRKHEPFLSSEHTDEYARYKPGGFVVSRGSILAVGSPKRIELEDGASPFSVVDLVANPKVADGLFLLDYEEERIKIYVSPSDKQRIEAIRARGLNSLEIATLFPGIYLHAISDALRLLDVYPSSRWTHAITGALKRHNLSREPQIARNNAIEYAQKIMEKPVERLMTALLGKED